MSLPSYLRVWLLWLQQTSCSCNPAQRCFYFVLCSGGAAKGGAPKGGTSHKTAAGVDIRQLENDDDDGPMKLAKPSMELRLALSQARNAKGLSQKDFAAKLMIPASVIQDYESGKAIPNNGLIAKMERALGERNMCTPHIVQYVAHLREICEICAHHIICAHRNMLHTYPLHT